MPELDRENMEKLVGKDVVFTPEELELITHVMFLLRGVSDNLAKDGVITRVARCFDGKDRKHIVVMVGKTEGNKIQFLPFLKFMTREDMSEYTPIHGYGVEWVGDNLVEGFTKGGERARP